MFYDIGHPALHESAGEAFRPCPHLSCPRARCVSIKCKRVLVTWLHSRSEAVFQWRYQVREFVGQVAPSHTVKVIFYYISWANTNNKWLCSSRGRSQHCASNREMFSSPVTISHRITGQQSSYPGVYRINCGTLYNWCPESFIGFDGDICSTYVIRRYRGCVVHFLFNFNVQCYFLDLTCPDLELCTTS